MKKFNSKKFRLTATKFALAMCTVIIAMGNSMTAFAKTNGENADPSGLGGSGTMSTAITIVFWIVRVLIILIGGVPGVIKTVQGQADENPRDRNAGLATIGIAGATFAASFAVEALI